MGTQPAAGVGNLVMVLQKGHKHRRLQVQGRGAPPLLLPCVILPLVEAAILEGRDQLLRGAVIISVIRLVAAGHRHHSAVVEVVVPERVKAIAALRRGADQLGVLRLVLAHQQGGAATRRLPHPAGHGRQNVVRRSVIDVLRGIDAQAVEVKLLNPVAGIGQEILADRTGMGSS